MRSLVFILSALCAALPARSQDYPTRPVHIIVPYTPGTGADILARLIGPKLGERWKAAVVADNKPGVYGTMMCTGRVG